MKLFFYFQRRLAHRVSVEDRRFYELSSNVFGSPYALCPHCRRGHLVADPAARDRRTCDDPACGASAALADIARTYAVVETSAAEIVAHERRQAALLIVSAEVIIVLAAGWAVWTGSWATLGGAVLLAAVICVTALLARYRAWQIENGRLFEAKAPLADYLRAEATAILGRR